VSVRDRLRALLPAPLLEATRALRRRRDLARSLRALRRVPATADPHEAFRMASAFQGWGDFARITPLQEEREVCALVALARDEGARHAAEIGSFLGGTLFMMTRLFPDDADLLSVDWPEVADDETMRFPAARKAFHEGFARARQRVRVIHGDSHAPATIARVEAALGGRPLDFLFIDGDHSLAGVRADFAAYARLVRPGGLIAFHDIVPHDTRALGVPEFWQGVKDRFRHRELVDEATRARRRGAGVGVLWWDPASAPPS
jgi:predicted O-methyltransferase YrrM